MTILTKQHNCQVQDLGLIDYDQAYQAQMQCVQKALHEDVQTIILCEHPPILTLGRLADQSYILAPQKELSDKGVCVKHIDRGGEVTLHAPGQLVIYPILNLNYWKKDLHAYLYSLEEVAIDLLKDFGIVAERNLENTGVFSAQDKIVSMGVGVKKWVTYHGMAINIKTDLSLFSLIKPCGLDVQMTSMEQILNREISTEDVKRKVIQRLLKHFQLETH